MTKSKQSRSSFLGTLDKSQKIQVLALLFALTGLASSILSVLLVDGGIRSPAILGSSPADMENEVAMLRNQLREVEAKLADLISGDREISESVELVQIARKTKRVEERLAKIERIILRNPEEALAIPVLRMDIERAQELNAARLDALSKNLERTYTLIIATLVALALAVITPALSKIFGSSPDMRRGTGGELKSGAPKEAAGADG